MIVNLVIIISIALIMANLFEKLRLPGLLGMLFTGILFGPYMKEICFSRFSITHNYIVDHLFIHKDLIHLSSQLRTAALIVILIRAGLGLNREVLNKIGKTAVKMSFIPGLLEGGLIILTSMYFLKFSFPEAGTLGFIIAAVSPAVVVPSMLNFKEKGLGKDKEIPTLVLTGASVDDVFAITIFGVFLNLAMGKSQNIAMMLIDIPVSIILGIASGALLGYLFVKFFKKYRGIRDTKKLLIFLTIAILYHELEHFIPIASLIGIMTMGFVILEKYDILAHRLARKFNKVWVLAEIILFVLIGAAVNINEIFTSGLLGVLIIAVGLVGRSFGVMISLHKSGLNIKEKIFCIVAYIPKATVQAAIGAIPLSMGLASGNIILAIAVLSIVITAPLGLIGIRWLGPKTLSN